MSTTTYSVQFSNQSFPFDKKVEIYHSKINNNSASQYFVFLDGKLYRYTYDNYNWHNNLLLNTTIDNQVIHFPKTLENKESLLLLKNNDGINFYRFEDNQFNILLRSNEYDSSPFGSLGDWSKPGNIIKCGNFYSDQNVIGILSKNEIYGLQFHAVIEEHLKPEGNPFISLREDNLKILSNINASKADFFLADIKRKGQENIIVRDSNGLNIYEFDPENVLHHILQVPESSKINDYEENIFFPDLTGQPLKDIVLFNTSGLFVFQYNVRQDNYQIIHYNPLFDAQRGWNHQYIDTVRFEDINLDGKQEMFFTGPKGMDVLTFNNYTLQWESLLDVSGIPVPDRHSKIIEIVPRTFTNTKYPVLFTEHEKEMHWAEIVDRPLYNDYEADFELPSKQSTDVSTSLSVIPELIKLEIAEEDKPHILLRDHLDCSSIISGVDKDTGKANFKLPLIGLPNFSKDEKINFYYNGNNKDSTILGVGWSFPMNAIVMDHQGSIFPENERYFLLLEDEPQSLIIDLDNSTDDVYNFKLSDQESKTRIRYFKNDERWEIDYEGVKQIYGRRVGSHDDSISYDLAWEHWRGAGSSPQDQVELATTWFLTEVRSGENSAIYYTYDINNVTIPESRKKFTREVYLKRISDNEGNTIIFNYADKNSNEFYLPPLMDVDGSYNAKKVQTRYLAGYSISTYSYRQDINFIYEVKNRKRLLTEIDQERDPTNRPVLQFFYMTILKSYEIELVILPTAANVEFSYKIISGTDESNIIQNIDLSVNVRNSYKVDCSHDFVLISYLNNYKHVVLRMFNKELTNEMYSSLSPSDSQRFPFLGKNEVLYYEVKILKESFAVVLDYGNSKDLCLMHKDKDKWLLNAQYYNYDKDADIQIGNDFIAVLDSRKILLEIIVWNKKNNEWIKEKLEDKLIENSTNSLLRVSGKVFFIYDDNLVTVGYRNKENKWQSKSIITLPGMISEIKNSMNKFDLDTDVRNQYVHFLKNNAFQIINNFVLLNSWSVVDTKIYSKIELLSLNSKYDVVHQESYKVFHDDLTEISAETEVQFDDKLKIGYNLAYKKVAGQFKLFLKNFKETSQQNIDEFCKGNPSENCASELKKEIERQVNVLHKKDFIINLKKYSTYLQSSMLICGKAKFSFTGNKWKMVTVTEEELKPEKWSAFMDDKFVLRKENSQSSIKLYDQSKNKKEKLILDLKAKNIHQIFNRYPKYLAFHTENKGVKLVFYEFLDNSFIKKFPLPTEETLSLNSDYNMLITHAEISNNTDNEHLTLNLRKLSSIKNNVPNAVIRKLTVYFDNGYQRITGYDYDPSSGKVMSNILYYEKTYIIPGNEKPIYGFIEESKNSTNVGHVINKIYDGQGNLVKLAREEQSSIVKKGHDEVTHKPEESEYVNSVLFDVTGHLEVAEFYPYEMQDDEVSYYGFENYEVNKIGPVSSTDQNRWLFNESSIIKQEFSLTGENYLSLKNNRLLGTFSPRNLNQNYVASCWIRSQGENLKIGTIAPYLKAVVYANDNREINGYFSEVKFQYDDWNYLEVVVDIFYSKKVFDNLLLKTHNLPDQNPFKIVVTVSPNLNSTLDVDHVRFSPLNADFQATTYNFKTKEIKEVINSNGLIKRYLYNDYLDQIVSINENGEVGKLYSYTKASSIDRIVKLKSKIEIQPNGGFYEDFNPHSFTKRWKVDNDLSWKIAPSEIHHRTNQFDHLKLRNMNENFDSYGIRLHYSLQSDSSIIRFNDGLELKREDNKATIRFSEVRAVPLQGEVLIIVERNRLMVWIDGGLYFDQGGLDKLLFDVQMYGEVKIRDVLVFFEPSVHVTYFNALGEKVQEINLESTNTAIVTEYLYDELGRQCITTKSTRLERSDNQPVVAYYPDFVTNKNPLSNDSVWKLGRIQGAFEILEPHNYYQVTYSDNPLSENSAIGLPGEEFSVRGKFAKRFSSTTENEFINEHYPVDQSYRYYVEHKLGGVEELKVFDKRNNTVAMLIKAPGKKDLLSTYKYNDGGKLVQMLTPLYHNMAGTSYNIGSHLRCFSKEENSLRITNSYDKKGNIITETTPDSGKVEYIYSDSGQLKFKLFYSDFNSTAVENVIYFDYDHLGRLTNTGKLISPPTKEKLWNMTLTESNTKEYQSFYHSDFEREPTLRGRLKRSITHNDGMPFVEEYLLNEDRSFSSKRIMVLQENPDEHLIIATNKKYRAGKLTEIEYPVDVQGKPFKVTYKYDKLGRVKGIGLPEKENLFVKYTYNSDGLIETEHHIPDRINFNFTRKYNYNSASYLTRLEDKFLTENVYYTEGNYGDRGYGDGTISRTEFEATWHQYADSDKISLNEQSFASEYIKPAESKLCFNKLKNAGYINQYNHQAKIYYPFAEVDFPRICIEGTAGRQIQSILGKQGFPSKYGHLYDYGAYQELIKAKYFVGTDIPAPLQSNTFAKIIPKIDKTMSREIWKLLNDEGYVIADRVISNEALTDDPYSMPHGKKGHSIIRSTLSDDLKDINNNYKHYRLLLENALINYFSKRQDFALTKFNLRKIFSEWSQSGGWSLEKDINAITEMLEKKGYLQNPLDKNFNDLLEKYQSVFPEIVKVLSEHFNKQLGEAEFDIEAYEIDENGNHKHFYNGFERYKLEYRSNSNQIETINFQSYVLPKPDCDFPVKHDSRGNVIQALHKGIQNITYHSVSNRATSIEMVNGKKIVFHYDAQGERVLKRVLDPTGEVKKEVHYVRDEFGRSLVEREVTWSSPSLPPSVLVTAFIYGPKGLVGFVRRDEYYSVITDHEGSIRLVVKDGEVVAAYDYLPYGNLMRQYGTNSEAHISYRYTGQEWDEETDLYNYHARFYDPSIGRFYQHDPKMQYFSPYKYAGNSPVSVVDPNGELALLVIVLIIALGAGGAYLGGAAASGTWNPAMWNYKDPKLYAGILFGGIGGALLPVMLPASYAAFGALGFSSSASIALTFGVGTVGAYAGMARSASEWNPAKWDFTNPELWNGGFVGFSTFAGAPGGIYTGVTVYRSLPTVLSKSAFIGGTVVAGGGLIALRLGSRKYDFSSPDLYYDVLESVIFAADIPMVAAGGYRFFKKNIGNTIKGIKTRRLLRSGYSNLNEAQQLNSIWRSISKLLVGITFPSLAGVFVSAAYSEDGLDFTQTTTYEAFVNGAMMALGLTSHARSSYKNRRLMKKRKVNQELIGLAQKSVDEYIKIIQFYKFPVEAYKSNIRSQLAAKKIPNTVLSVVKMKDGMAFVAYSGLYGPGFLSSFRIQGESHVTSEHNRYIGYFTETPEVPREVALNDNEMINNVIMEALDAKNQVLKSENYDVYLKEKDSLNSIFTELLSSVDTRLDKSYFDGPEITSIMEKIEGTIQNTGYIGDQDMFKIIESPILREITKIDKKVLNPISTNLKKVREVQKDHRNLLSKIEENIADLERKMGLSETKIDANEDFEKMKRLLSDRINKLQTKQSELYSDLNNLRDVKKDPKKMLIEVYKNHFKKYSDKFIHWLPINCAEPHVISLLMRSPMIFPAHVRAKYTRDDIKYLAAYKVMQTREIPELVPMERCSNCQETTRTVVNVVSDPEWNIMLNRESEKIKNMPKSHFFPYDNITGVHNVMIKPKEESTRKKRSTVDKYINHQDLPISIADYDDKVSENYGSISDYAENDKSINNEEVNNFAATLFDWMRTSWNQLFDSKKFLPEKASMPNALKGITGSNNTLTTATALVDTNSTILLLDTLIRKVTGQKYVSNTPDYDTSLLEARGYSLDVGLIFEKTIKYAASKSGISMHRFNVHYMDIQEKIIDKIMSGRLDEIADILISYVEKVCPLREKGCPGMLSPKKFNKFMKVFSKRIDAELNEIMQTNKSIKGI